MSGTAAGTERITGQTLVDAYVETKRLGLSLAIHKAQSPPPLLEVISDIVSPSTREFDENFIIDPEIARQLGEKVLGAVAKDYLASKKLVELQERQLFTERSRLEIISKLVGRKVLITALAPLKFQERRVITFRQQKAFGARDEVSVLSAEGYISEIGYMIDPDAIYLKGGADGTYRDGGGNRTYRVTPAYVHDSNEPDSVIPQVAIEFLSP